MHEVWILKRPKSKVNNMLLVKGSFLPANIGYLHLIQTSSEVGEDGKRKKKELNCEKRQPIFL